MPLYYTRAGDKGTTGLFSGKKVSKDDPRLEAYGTLDELNSLLGLCRAFSKDAKADLLLKQIQEHLFVISSDLATPAGLNAKAKNAPRAKEEFTSWLEREIEELAKQQKLLKRFIFPGGAPAGALLHYARAVCRRAEREIVKLSKKEKINPAIVPYVNRLSSLLFVLARHVNAREGAPEEEWKS